jgi:hypothetical protein
VFQVSLSPVRLAGASYRSQRVWVDHAQDRLDQGAAALQPVGGCRNTLSPTTSGRLRQVLALRAEHAQLVAHYRRLATGHSLSPSRTDQPPRSEGDKCCEYAQADSDTNRFEQLDDDVHTVSLETDSTADDCRDPPVPAVVGLSAARRQGSTQMGYAVSVRRAARSANPPASNSEPAITAIGVVAAPVSGS